MLSFFYNAFETVKQMDLPLSHPWITTPKKADLYFKVHLTKQGKIKRVDKLNAKEAQSCYYVKKDDANNAPIFDLYKAEEFKDKDKIKFLQRKIFDPVKRLCNLTNTHFPTKQLWARLKLRNEEPLQFFDEIMAAIIKSGTTEEEIEKAKKGIVILFENYQPITSDNSSLFFSITSRDALIDIFRNKSPESKTPPIRDIFGNIGTAITSPFPKNRYGGLTQFSPYQRNKDTPAYAKYGLNAMKACPLTAKSQERIFDALTGLTAPELRNKVWQHSTDVIGKKYVGRLTIILPDLEERDKVKKIIEDIEPLAILDAIENRKIPESKDHSERTADETVQQFKILAEPIINALLGKAIEFPEAQYKILVIRQFDKIAPITETQLSIPFKILAKRLQFWVNAISSSRNRTFGYFKDGKRIICDESKAIRPFELPNILNRCWKENAGIDAKNTPMKKYDIQISNGRFDLSAAFNLFLFHDRKVAQAMINQIARHHVWLMFDVAHRARHRQSVLIRHGIRGDVLKFLGLISILYRIQENLMTETQIQEAIDKDKKHQNDVQDVMSIEIAYRMGQALAIADRIQSKKFKTASQFPSSLVGESFFPIIIRGCQTKEHWTRFLARFDYLEKWARNQARVVSELEKEKKKIDPMLTELKKNYYWFIKVMKGIPGIDIPNKFSSNDKCLFVSGFYSIH